eukprot:m.75878 g.75878  ORF g.75878 m.75878 type:complete len:96 (-) comp8098_c0_seq1:178-465(-)
MRKKRSSSLQIAPPPSFRCVDRVPTANILISSSIDSTSQDDVFSRLLTFPNVLVTAHQAFFTREALRTIAETTAENLRCFAEGKQTDNELTRPAN